MSTGLRSPWNIIFNVYFNSCSIVRYKNIQCKIMRQASFMFRPFSALIRKAFVKEKENAALDNYDLDVLF